MGRLNLVLDRYIYIFNRSQYYEDTNEDDLGEILNAALDEAKSNVEEDQHNDSIMEYKHFILN